MNVKRSGRFMTVFVDPVDRPEVETFCVETFGSQGERWFLGMINRMPIFVFSREEDVIHFLLRFSDR